MKNNFLNWGLCLLTLVACSSGKKIEDLAKDPKFQKNISELSNEDKQEALKLLQAEIEPSLKNICSYYSWTTSADNEATCQQNLKLCDSDATKQQRDADAKNQKDFLDRVFDRCEDIKASDVLSYYAEYYSLLEEGAKVNCSKSAADAFATKYQKFVTDTQKFYDQLNLCSKLDRISDHSTADINAAKTVLLNQVPENVKNACLADANGMHMTDKNDSVACQAAIVDCNKTDATTKAEMDKRAKTRTDFIDKIFSKCGSVKLPLVMDFFHDLNLVYKEGAAANCNQAKAQAFAKKYKEIRSYPFAKKLEQCTK